MEARLSRIRSRCSVSTPLRGKSVESSEQASNELRLVGISRLARRCILRCSPRELAKLRWYEDAESVPLVD
jgi:hypothetical protein